MTSLWYVSATSTRGFDREVAEGEEPERDDRATTLVESGNEYSS
jgi:hypothetical protein